MTGLFERLLRSNFRCGRMLYPRAKEWVGCDVLHALQVSVG